MACFLQFLAKFHLVCIVLTFCRHEGYVIGARDLLSKGRETIEFPPDVSGLGLKLTLQRSELAHRNYIVKLGFGTPKQDLTLMFDTGSALTWIQCTPCQHCYDQQEPLFNPNQSSTFALATCDSSPTEPPCNYSIPYRDKSYSKGYYATDTVTFSESDTFPFFVFGCGQNTTTSFGQVAGVLGVGQGDASVMSKTVDSFLQIFCYCLPADNSDGYVVFGVEALKLCPPTFSIPLIGNLGGLGNYGVDLVGITIGGRRLDMSTTTTIIDSGTPISRLPEGVYNELRSEFVELMSKYPVAERSNIMDTCYNLESVVGDVEEVVPSMVMHFGDMKELRLDAYGVVAKQNGMSQVCLAFAATKSAAEAPIIGTHQHRSVKVRFDVLDKVLGFGTTRGC